MCDSPVEPISSLYVHVPFCARKCSYCAFFSEELGGGLVDRYIGALIRELELVAPKLRPDTIFFGGGTPSLLTVRQWEQVLRAMDRLGLLGAAEWTVECNPATVSEDKARLLRDWGVNRISMGVQSLNEELLDRLGRVHSRQMVFKSFDLLRRVGFDNLNLDLMFAIPGQTMAVWRETLKEATSLGSEHLSAYEVIYEEDTPLYAQLKAGEFDVDEELACAMYEELQEQAERVGLRQYEIANFAGRAPNSGEAPSSKLQAPKKLRSAAENTKDEKFGQARTIAGRDAGAPRADPRPSSQDTPALACRHNINYWRGGSFYGLGPSATSYIKGVRTKNWSNTQIYCEQLEKNHRAVESREELGALARAGETAAFGLRMTVGWPFDAFTNATGYDLRDQWSQDMDGMSRRGWGRRDQHRFQLTSEGLRFADAAAELFLRPSQE